MNKPLPTKESEYKVYRDLKWQEEMNPKDKFDNRLYVSMRYKHLETNSSIEDEIFKTKHNRETPWRIIYQKNMYWLRRMWLLLDNMTWGTNKYGQKKIYKLERFFEYRNKIFLGALFVLGYNLSYLGLALHYKKLEHDIWMNSFGDFFPVYEKVGIFTVRTYIRKIPYYLHSWKLVSLYNIRKYDLLTVQFPTGYVNSFALDYTCRQKEYERKRDDTFDFMQLGENDFFYYTDYLA